MEVKPKKESGFVTYVTFFGHFRLLAFVLNHYNRRSHPEGATFRLFLAAYLAWRLAGDFIKPQPLVHGMNLIQWSCVAGLVATLWL